MTALAENSRLSLANLQQQEEARKREVRFSRERERMLQDLHDGIGGITANISILSEVSRLSTGEAELRRALEVISSLSQVCSNEIRMFINSLDVDEQSWPNLTAEMKFIGLSMTEPHAIAFSFQASGLTNEAPPPCSVLYLNILRIYKESIANIVKHAAARSVVVGMAIMTDSLTLYVQDDGIGAPLTKMPGRGISHMESRARELGGEFALVVENGTRVCITVPIPIKYPSGGIADPSAP
jgi:signal transduction histidine kinase